MSAPVIPVVAPTLVPLPERPRWVQDADARVAELVERARRSIGVCEDPPGSNRGPEIDDWNRRAGVALASFWCASFVGAVWLDSGFAVPRGYASCDRLLAWGKATGRFTPHVPSLGALVLYGVGTDARHVGLVIRVTPLVMSIEGNTTVEGPAFERNGTSVALKLVTARDPVLGYVRPVPIT